MTQFNHNRRNFIKSSSLATLGLLVSQACKTTTEDAPPTILVLSGWQDMNIGDIAHTPGLIHVLHTFLPDHKIILWKRRKGEEADNMLRHHYPDIPLIYGNVDEQRNVDSEDVRAAFEEADIMVHGSGPSVRYKHLEAWMKHTNKPFGILGTTIGDKREGLPKELQEVLKKAAFVYTRETESLKVLEEAGISGEKFGFAPDATFFMDIRDDEKANKFLSENGLEPKKFICAIPRLRYSPSYKFKDVDWSEERIKMVDEVNAATKEKDHAKMREVMIAWVRDTGNKVLVCPEMTYQVDIMDELLIDPLPEDVKPFIVKRGYWMPDEAASVYAQTHTVVSFECHSPIMSVYNKTPAFYLRQPTDTIKGQMYYDLNLTDWVFEIDDTTSQQITGELMKIYNNYGQAKTKIEEVNANIYGIYEKATEVLKNSI